MAYQIPPYVPQHLPDGATTVEPVQIGSALVLDTGQQMLDFVVGVAPVAVPIVLGLTAVRWALVKFGLLVNITNEDGSRHTVTRRQLLS